MGFAQRGIVRVGLLAPESGPIGLFGPSSISCAKLAEAEINRSGGLLGRKLSLVFGDAGGTPDEVSGCVKSMIERHHVQAIVGSHTSPNREALIRTIGGRIPYVYTTQYEGDRYAFGVFMCGETPLQQVRPLIEWLRSNHGSRKWYVIGNDYSFPRQSIECAKGYISEVEGEIVGEEYVSLRTQDFHAVIARIEKSGADTVLEYLVGTDSIIFNRQFGSLASRVTRAAPVLCENALLAIGAQHAENLFSCVGFSNTLSTPEGLKFRDRYRSAFGATAPVPNRFGVSCYEGLHLLASLARRAESLNVFRLQAFAEGASLSTPRGDCRMHANHLGAPVHIARAKGLDLAIIDSVGYRDAATNEGAAPFGTPMGSA